MKSISLVIFWIALASCLFAQKEVVVKKSAEKTVSINVNKSDDGERTVKITTDQDGDEKVIEWTDNGEIPADVKKQLQEQGIDIAILGEDNDSEKNIWINIDEDVEVDGDHVRKKMVVIKKDGDADVMKLDWDGEGEMPAEMRKMLKEHDVDIDQLHEAHGKGHKMKMRMHKDKTKKMRRKAMKDGRQMNRQEKREYKIVTKDEDGNEKVIEWNGDGEMPEEMEGLIDDDVHVIKMKNREGSQRGRKMMFFSNDDDMHLSDAYMGAQIESGDNGARIIDVMKDSPADKAGLQRDDVIHRVNGARTRSMEGLLNILTHFDPADKVELIISRGGNEKKLEMTLGQRPDSYK